MMPGHEDREDLLVGQLPPGDVLAAMMPGHEDREDTERWPEGPRTVSAAMMPGHEDREDAPIQSVLKFIREPQ